MAGQPFRGSDFPFPNSNLRQVAHVLRPSRCGEGGHAGGLEGPKPPGATCPPIGPRWRTCSSPTSVARGAGQVAWRGRSHLEPPAQAQVAHVLQPSTCGEGGGAGGLEGAEALGATRALTWPQAAFGIYSRCFLHCCHMHILPGRRGPGILECVESWNREAFAHKKKEFTLTSQKEGIRLATVLETTRIFTLRTSDRPPSRPLLTAQAPTPRPSWGAAGSTGPLRGPGSRPRPCPR